MSQEDEKERRSYDPLVRELRRLVEHERDLRLRDTRILGDIVMNLDEMGIRDLSGTQRRLFPNLIAFYERDASTLSRMVEMAQVAVVLQEATKKRNATLLGLVAAMGGLMGGVLSSLFSLMVSHHP